MFFHKNVKQLQTDCHQVVIHYTKYHSQFFFRNSHFLVWWPWQWKIETCDSFLQKNTKSKWKHSDHRKINAQNVWIKPYISLCNYRRLYYYVPKLVTAKHWYIQDWALCMIAYFQNVFVFVFVFAFLFTLLHGFEFV